MTPIGFKEEFLNIIDCIERLKIKFRFKYEMATQNNLKDCLNQKPIGLHFSGHGFQNKIDSFSNDRDAFAKNQLKGDFLLFEQKNGASINMYASTLKEILNT